MTGSATNPKPVPRAARAVREDWGRLRAPAGTLATFDPRDVRSLPEPARRWLTHAIAPGTPLWRSAELTMHGRIRLGAWRTFTARQVLAPPDGYIWAATARFLGLPVIGYDRLSSGVGEMRWRLLNAVPVMTADGRDVTRSAQGRLAAEVVLAPTTFRAATWTSGEAPDIAVATWRMAEESEHVELRLTSTGALRSVVMQRWGNPLGAPYGRYPFGVTVQEEGSFGGVTIPTEFRAGWWWGTDRERRRVLPVPNYRCPLRLTKRTGRCRSATSGTAPSRDVATAPCRDRWRRSRRLPSRPAPCARSRRPSPRR
jgi:hypothetical protein